MRCICVGNIGRSTNSHSARPRSLATAIMGFVVWAMRDSLPPEGKTFGLVAQRTLVPVAVGILVYFMAASGLLSSRGAPHTCR